jgi:hypothetical protein
MRSKQTLNETRRATILLSSLGGVWLAVMAIYEALVGLI